MSQQAVELDDELEDYEREYSWEEAPEELKERILEEQRDINTEGFDWWDCLYEIWEEKLEALGFLSPKMHFSGFWSQGDGACIEASVDFETWLKSHGAFVPGIGWRHASGKPYEWFLPFFAGEVDGMGDMYFKSQHSCSNYYHSNTLTFDYDYPMFPGEGNWDTRNQRWIDHPTGIDALARELMEDLKQEIKDLSDELYRDLEKEYEYLTSDEAVIETIEANDYKFDWEGKIA